MRHAPAHFANLISNALRYTKNGQVLVGVRRKGDSIRIDVIDTGPGIPKESREDIFWSSTNWVIRNAIAARAWG